MPSPPITASEFRAPTTPPAAPEPQLKTATRGLRPHRPQMENRTAGRRQPFRRPVCSKGQKRNAVPHRLGLAPGVGAAGRVLTGYVHLSAQAGPRDLGGQQTPLPKTPAHRTRPYRSCPSARTPPAWPGFTPQPQHRALPPPLPPPLCGDRGDRHPLTGLLLRLSWSLRLVPQPPPPSPPSAPPLPRSPQALSRHVCPDFPLAKVSGWHDGDSEVGGTPCLGASVRASGKSGPAPRWVSDPAQRRRGQPKHTPCPANVPPSARPPAICIRCLPKQPSPHLRGAGCEEDSR